MTHHDDARFDDLLAQLGDGDTKDLFRRLLERGMQELIDAELTATIGAELHERTDTRTNQRNGARERTLSTPAGDIELRIPKLRVGSFFPSLLEPRRRVDQALWAVIMTAYITGTSTRKVDDLVRALGCESGVSKSTCQPDLQGHRRRSRRVPHPTARSPRDALRVPGRDLHQGPQQPSHRRRAPSSSRPRSPSTGTVKCSASMSATPKTKCSGPRSCARCATAASTGVRLVISDAHAGLKASIARVFAGASWQRCKVHLARNILATVNHAHKDMVAATVRTIHAQPDAEATRAQLHAVVGMLEDRFPKAAEILAAAEGDVTAYAAFPRAHWRKISSHEPARADQQRDQAPLERGRDLPRRRLGDPPRRRRPVGATRRMGRRRTPLPQRRIHGPHRPTPQGGEHHRTTPNSRPPKIGRTKPRVTDLLPPHHGTRPPTTRAICVPPTARPGWLPLPADIS